MSAPESSADKPAAEAKATSKKPSRRPAFMLGGLAIAAVIGWFVHARLTADEEDTDDAQVEADVVPIAARTGGAILHLSVVENQIVHAGDVLVEIDPAEPTARLQAAQAELATARAQAAQADAQAELTGATASATLHSARAGVSSAVDAVHSADAQIAAAQAAVDRAAVGVAAARRALDRSTALRQQGSVAQAELDDAQTRFDDASANEAQARAQLATATASRSVATAHVGEAHGQLEQREPVDTQVAIARAAADVAHAHVTSAEAALALAQLTLSYTRVVAVRDGVVSRLAVHEGQLIVPSQTLAMLVPTETYLVANFKETQIGRMHPGDRVDVHVDAFPGVELHGRIESLSSGTGSRFSLLPPDNASGNFVRVVQRVPVRISWQELPAGVELRPGLSADVVVHVGTQAEAHAAR
jgi:membrane fusion protein (multidrug efflux system)